jgi:hypothetical protein
MPDDTKTDAEKAADEKAAEEAKAKSAEGKESSVEFDGEFDPERAKRAIAAGREDAKKLKAKLAEQATRLEGFESVETAKAEADKSNEQKLVEKDARIAALEVEASDREVKADFMTEADGRGYQSLSLAYIAAKEQGLLGKRNKQTGDVGDHDFEALEESHDLFATEAGREGARATGDAGARGGQGKTTSVGGQFNKAIRKQLNR